MISMGAEPQESWQRAVNLLATMLGVPAGLVMECHEGNLTVGISSQRPGNPYRPGQVEEPSEYPHYYEAVMSGRCRLHVPDARQDEKWKNNPDMALDMITYLGYPVFGPDNGVFGTICVLDRRPRVFSKEEEALIRVVKDLIEGHLAVLAKREEARDIMARLKAREEEVEILRQYIPVCSRCKNVRDDEGNWLPMEVYFQSRLDSDFTHGLCPVCLEGELRQVHR
jgi:GAF domain-containing protein